MVGRDVRSLHDKTGNPFGEQMYQNAQDGQTVTVGYMAPVTGSTDQVPKRAYVTRIDNQVCGVNIHQFQWPRVAADGISASYWNT